MLPCFCSVIDHRWRQNVVRTKNQTLTSSVIYYQTDARQHGIYLFYIIKKKPNYHRKKLFLFQNLSTRLESRPLPTPPTLTNTGEKKPFHVIYCLYKWSNLIAKEFWLAQENHATVKLDSSVASHGMRSQRKQNWTANSTNLTENAGKVKSSFCHQSSPVSRKAWMLPRISQEFKNTLGKVAVAVNTGGHLISRFEWKER